MTLHAAVVGPLDVARLVAEFGLESSGRESAPVLSGGHPATTSLVVALAPLVDRLELVTLDHRRESPAQFVGEHVRLSVGPMRPRARSRARDLYAAERRFIAGQLASSQPDAVSAHWTYEFALGTLDSGLPHLITVHDWAPAILWSMRDKYRTVRLLMQLLTFARGRNFAAVSPYMARRAGLLTRGRVAVLPNGLESSWYEERLQQPSQMLVLAVNHGFARHKNTGRLLTAWPDVLLRHPTAELVLAGNHHEPDGPASKWAQERGLTHRVRFVGPVEEPELKDLLQSASVFAHPSLEESFGLVALEAMAQGVPVVGGLRSGAIPWLLEAGAGVLIDVRKPEAIADAITTLLADPDVARSTGSRGHARALDFTIEGVALAYRDQLSSIASQRTG